MNHRKNMETNEETSMKNNWRTKLKTENEESSEMMAFGGSQRKEFRIALKGHENNSHNRKQL